MLPPMRRLPELRRLIDQKAYFVLHAPRQTGKTTALAALGMELTAEGRYVSTLLSLETGAPFGDEPEVAQDGIVGSWRSAARAFLPADLQPPEWPAASPAHRVGAALEAWARAAPRPLVLFLDEADALRGQTLLSVLRQLRDGYRSRPAGFPWSLALIGLRDIRDYRVEEDQLGTASPFNIKVVSIRLEDFREDEVGELYAQHTAETGQVFQPEAVARAFYLSQGQPWLVNALAKELVEQLVPDPAQPITAQDVERAKEVLIARKDTHLDSLAARLREPRVRRIVEPMLAGRALGDVSEEDLQFLLDLGLVRIAPGGGVEVANPIYREVIPRVLITTPRASLPMIPATWLTETGRLASDRLLDAFLVFWRQHGQPMLGSAHYTEVAPQLVLMAFLDRVANGGGTIDREYAVGTGRIDLCLRYGPDRLAMELKVWHPGQRDPLPEGLDQLDRYLAGLSLDTGWLVLFDRRENQPAIAERTSAERAETPGGRSVMVIRA